MIGNWFFNVKRFLRIFSNLDRKHTDPDSGRVICWQDCRFEWKIGIRFLEPLNFSCFSAFSGIRSNTRPLFETWVFQVSEPLPNQSRIHVLSCASSKLHHFIISIG